MAIRPPKIRRLRRSDMRRAAPALPNGFTIGNLFFGIFAIIDSSRGEYSRAVLWIVLGGICDGFDGRVARATGTGSRFGEELDSLVDAVSFGLAPAMIEWLPLSPTYGGVNQLTVWGGFGSNTWNVYDTGSFPTLLYSGVGTAGSPVNVRRTSGKSSPRQKHDGYQETDRDHTEQLIGAAALRFRAIEREVGAFHQLICIEPVIRRDRDADADADMDRLIFERRRTDNGRFKSVLKR